MKCSSANRPVVMAALFLAVLLASACGGVAYEKLGSSEAEAPLGGEALLQRKHDLTRALQDVGHFHATMSTLVTRQDTVSISLLDEFLAKYLERHVDPMLRSQWQSGSAELASVDASLRFAKAELLIQLRDPRLVQATIEDIERRYRGRDSMLVEYPLGEQGTLSEGLEILKDRKWKG